MAQVIVRVIITVLAVSYPFLVFSGLVLFKTSPRMLGVGLLVLGLVSFLFRSNVDKNERFKKFQSLFMLLAAVLISVLTFLFDGVLAIKFYPVAINVFLFSSFFYTLLVPPTMILRFATLKDKNLVQSPDGEKIKNYCKIITIIWCGFFLINALIAAITAIWVDEFVWALYNGLISYILMGTLLGGEFLYRKLVLKV